MGHVMCPVTLPLVVAGDGGGCLKLRALAGRSLSVFLSLSIQAVAYLPVEYSSGARNGDRYGKEAENVQRTWLCELFCFALLFFRSAPQNFPPKKILSRRNIAFDDQLEGSRQDPRILYLEPTLMPFDFFFFAIHRLRSVFTNGRYLKEGLINFC